MSLYPTPQNKSSEPDDDSESRRESWRERRLAWAMHHAGLGPAPAPLPEIDYAADTVITALPVPAVSSTYAGSTFEAACAKADAEYLRKHGKRPVLDDIPIVAIHGVPSAATLQREYERAAARRQGEHLPASTRSAIDYLLKENDEARLRKFLEGRPRAEVKKIIRYIKGKPRG